MTWSEIWPVYWPLYLTSSTRVSGDVMWFGSLAEGGIWLAVTQVVKGGIWLGVWLLYCASSLGANIGSSPAGLAVDVTTQRYDNARTGANLFEKLLKTSNVSPAHFEKLFTRAVDDDVYAQPLYLRDVILPNSLVAVGWLPAKFKQYVNEELYARHLGRVANVLYVATVSNSVYAFDADDPGAATPLWHVNLTDAANGARPVRTSDVGQDCGTYRDFRRRIGIVGTPVIDAKTNTLYVVARTKEDDEFIQRLHALDIATGAERASSPVVVGAQVKGTGSGSSDGVIAFDPRIENQRAALLLANGIVYIAWGAHCDTGPYHGWLMGYDAKTLTQVFAKNVTPDGEKGGIWQSNAGPSADVAGNIYLTVGNGTVSAPVGGNDYGNGILKFGKAGEVLDWFIPWNYATLNQSDGDLGTTGVLLIPGTDLLATGSKEGKLYVLNRNDLGHFQAGADRQIVQDLWAGPGWLLGTPTYWEGPNGANVYVWCSASPARAFRLAPQSQSGITKPERGARMTPLAIATSAEPDDQQASPDQILTEFSRTSILGNSIPGGMLSVSANGASLGSGILWASLGLDLTYMGAIVQGVLRAFDANDLSRELWNSQQNGSRDQFGNFAKFNTPVVANGKVYLATFSKQVAVYGLRDPANAPPSVSAGFDLTPDGMAKLFASVDDDGLPRSPGTLTKTWVQVSGPAQAVIENPHDLTTTASFPAPGRYLLRFTASDGELGTDTDITVNVPPSKAGLVGHWTFQESMGVKIKDFSGNGNDGVLVPANPPEPHWGTGEFSGSVSLSAGEHVRIPASVSLNRLKRHITVVAHVYPRELPTQYIAVVQRQWREAIHPDLFYLGYGPANGVLNYKWHSRVGGFRG